MSAAKSGECAGIFLCPIWAPHGIRAGFPASTLRLRSAEPSAAEHEGEQSDLRAAARDRVVCARAAPDRVFLSLTPSHFFPAVGNGGAPGS